MRALTTETSIIAAIPCPPMKILCISDLPPFVTGGAESQAARLVHAWAKGGHEVICMGRQLPNAEINLDDGVRVVARRIRTIRRLGRLARAVSYFASLATLLLREARSADIVYCRFIGDAAITAALLKRIGCIGAPLVSTPASSGPGGDVAYFKSVPGTKFLIALLDRACDRINIIAPALADELLSAGFSGDNFSSIPNGIPISPLLRTRTPSGTLQMVCVSRMVEQKGIDLLIQALGSLADTNWRLDLIGDGPETDRLKALALQSGIADKIGWLGWLDAKGVRERLMQSDLFVLPSRYEGMSNAALEAMEAGLPLVLTGCGGIDRHIDPSIGWVAPTNDVAALSVALKTALSTRSEVLEAMGRRARELAIRTFSIDTTARQHIKMFQLLLSTAHAGRA